MTPAVPYGRAQTDLLSVLSSDDTQEMKIAALIGLGRHARLKAAAGGRPDPNMLREFVSVLKQQPADASDAEALTFWYYGTGGGDDVNVTLKDNRAADPGLSGYSGRCANLTEAERAARRAEGREAVIRFRIGEGTVEFPNGDRWRGPFVDDEPRGLGTLTESSSSSNEDDSSYFSSSYSSCSDDELLLSSKSLDEE